MVMFSSLQETANGRPAGFGMSTPVDCLSLRLAFPYLCTFSPSPKSNDHSAPIVRQISLSKKRSYDRIHVRNHAYRVTKGSQNSSREVKLLLTERIGNNFNKPVEFFLCNHVLNSMLAVSLFYPCNFPAGRFCVLFQAVSLSLSFPKSSVASHRLFSKSSDFFLFTESFHIGEGGARWEC
jgi:hypothetical protein